MAGPSNTEVPRIELNADDTINLVVDVYGFAPGTPVEISGTVTQENGAVATFNTVRPMPPGGIVNLTSVPVVPGINFAAGFPITVVARAAQVWITTLGEDAASAGVQSRLSGAQMQTAWQVTGARWAVSWPGQNAPAVWTSEYTPQSSSQSNLIPHGKWWDQRKGDSAGDLMLGRFTRLFPGLDGAQFDQQDLQLLAEAMTAQPQPPESGDDPEENPGLPAAYTYLGQFVDHDLTFDPISQLRAGLPQVRLKALVDFRTPRFDLDNLYGHGPDDQPYMYQEDGVHLLPGDQMPGHAFDPGAVQLPRGPNGRALIGDSRDDENRIVAQLHALFLRFHNRLADRLAGPQGVSFAARSASCPPGSPRIHPAWRCATSSVA